MNRWFGLLFLLLNYFFWQHKATDSSVALLDPALVGWGKWCNLIATDIYSCFSFAPDSRFPPQTCFYVLFKVSLINQCPSLWMKSQDRTDVRNFTISLLSFRKHITLGRRRPSVLDVHPGATPIWRGGWSDEAGGGRGGSSSLCTRRDDPQPQWTTRLLGLHR